MDRIWLAFLRTLRGEWKEMGGPGSGHWRHAGRKGKKGGSAPSKAGKGVSKPMQHKRHKALMGVLNSDNAKDLDIPEDGALWNAKDKRTGLYASRAMYNPKTGTFLAGADVHAITQAKYAPSEKYDDFVKIVVNRGMAGKTYEVQINTDRHQARSVKKAWDMTFDAAKVFKKIGFSSDTYIILHSNDISKRSQFLKLEEI